MIQPSGTRWLRHAFIAILLLAAAGAGAQPQTDVSYLSGQGKDDPVEWDFYCTAGRNSGQWTTIGVPSNWELRGFGTYNYGHDRNKGNEQGKYRKKFALPDGWTGKRIFLVFDGVMTDTEVWVNGRSAGAKHQGGFYRFKYEITDLVRAGENLLEVTVSKVSANRSVEQAERQADYWVFGGIFRPVYLEAVPKEFIERVAIDARANGDFRMDVYLNGGPIEGSVQATVAGRPGSLSTPVAPGVAKVTVRGRVDNINPWTAETPNLYEVDVALVEAGAVVHTVKQRFGFRTFDVRTADGFYVNGRKVRLKGVNRHSFWPDSGRCLSRQISYDDVRLIKQMNMNAVRLSHYPPDAHFLDACDELGLYVLDELAGWQKPPYDTDIGKKLIAEMVPRDVCHPCILFWDNGNEGGWNPELDSEFSRYDPQKRTVLHPWAIFNGIDTDHYESYSSTRRKLGGSLTFLPTEFLHGLYDGGHGAGLDDYWNLMFPTRLGAGGFLWALVDEGVVRTDQGGRIDVSGNQAPDGIVGPYRQKEASFYTIKEIWSPIRIELTRLGDDFAGRLEVENRYGFTNLNRCSFDVQLVSFPSPWEGRDGHSTPMRYTITGPDVPPGARGTLELALPASWRTADALHVTAYNADRREVWTWSWAVRSREDAARRSVARKAAGAGQVTVTPGADAIDVEAGDLHLRFGRTSGELLGVSVGGQAVAFGGGPRLVGGENGTATVTWARDGDDAVVNAAFEGAMDYIRWRVSPSGWVGLDYQYALTGQVKLLGVNFSYPEENMRSMRWLGRGPYRVWKNRMKGGRFDVWSNPYKDHVPGQTWDFPEFRGYYRDWNWVRFETTEAPVTMVNATDGLFLGVYRPNDGPDPKNTKLDVLDTGIGLLHGIPAIGTKFQTPEALGPASQKNDVAGTYRGTVWFHFGN